MLMSWLGDSFLREIMSNSGIPDSFVSKFGDRSMLDLSALLCEGMDQNFNDPSENSYLRYRLLHDSSLAA